MFERMQRSRNKKKKKKKKKQQQQQLQTRCSKAFCATCRLNDLSSPEEGESSNEADEFKTVSSIAHAMVQVRLDQMIRERKEGRSGGRRRWGYEDEEEDEETKLVVVVAMEKSSYDPREDFRESMEEIIVANQIQETKDLRRLLNYYVCMNSEEFRGTILEVFHQVCSDLFLKYF